MGRTAKRLWVGGLIVSVGALQVRIAQAQHYQCECFGGFGGGRANPRRNFGN